MKNIVNISFILFLLLASVIAALPGCVLEQVSGSGNIISRNFELTDFTKVKIGYGFTAEVKASSTYTIEVSADDNLFDYLVVKKDGDTVSIRLKTGGYTQTHLKAAVSMPGLQGIELADGSRVTVSGFSASDNLAVKIADGSSLSGSLKAGNVTVNLSDGSRIQLSGSAGTLKLNSHDGSQAILGDFTVTDADLTVGDGGISSVNVNGTLNVKLSAGSHVTYTGNPTMGSIELSSGATLSKKN